MDLDFLSTPEDGIFLALIFKENPGCGDDILGVFLLDEAAAANASFLATDGITKGKPFIECLPDNFLLASEAFLLESEALLLASEAFLLESEALLFESEVLLLDWEPLLLASEAFLLESETFLLEAEAFLLEETASFLEVDAFLLELEAPLLDLETFFLPEIFGPEDIFKALVGTRFPLMRMGGIRRFELNEEPFLAVILFNFLEIILDDFRFLESFLLRLIGVDEAFLFLFDIVALLKSSSRSLLTSRCILLDLDLTMFLSLFLEMLWLTGEITGKNLNL